jgi:hypothetical protein
MIMRTKEKWLYVFKDPNLDLDANQRNLDTRLPKQALGIAKILKRLGAIKRLELLSEMQSTTRTKQRGGVNRILAYYQGLLTKRNIIEVRKQPD